VFERATGVQAPGEQGGRAARGSVRGDQLAEPDGVGADGVRGGPGKYLHRTLTGGIGRNLPQPAAPLDFVHAIEEVSNFT
jgi:hypothetical protein